MAYSVELMLAAPAAGALDELCDQLEEDPGIGTYRRLGSAPHISLAVFDNIEVGPFSEAVSAFARNLEPLPIHLNALGVFCHEKSVLFIAPVVTRQLLKLHEDFHRAFAAFNKSCWDYYRPGNWVPHVTLAMNLTAAALSTAIGKLTPLWRERDTMLNSVRFISFPPFHLIARHNLTQPPETER